MRVAEVAGLEGVGGEVSGLIRLWKSVEKCSGCWKLERRRKPQRCRVAREQLAATSDVSKCYRPREDLGAIGQKMYWGTVKDCVLVLHYFSPFDQFRGRSTVHIVKKVQPFLVPRQVEANRGVARC
jgi:hypothetical protein